jgi:hypothetical protein
LIRAYDGNVIIGSKSLSRSWREIRRPAHLSYDTIEDGAHQITIVVDPENAIRNKAKTITASEHWAFRMQTFG